MTARVVLVTREGCHLCDDARAVVDTVCAELGETWRELDVDRDVDEVSSAQREVWTDQVPVTLVDGKPHDFWRVDASRLRLALERTT